MAAGHRVDAGRWNTETDRLLDRMATRFPRVETHRRVRGFLFGLLADMPQKNDEELKVEIAQAHRLPARRRLALVVAGSWGVGTSNER